MDQPRSTESAQPAAGTSQGLVGRVTGIGGGPGPGSRRRAADEASREVPQAAVALPPGALTLHTDRSSFRLSVVWSAGARFGDHAHPTAHRTFTQIDGRPRVWSSAERHL